MATEKYKALTNYAEFCITKIEKSTVLSRRIFHFTLLEKYFISSLHF